MKTFRCTIHERLLLVTVNVLAKIRNAIIVLGFVDEELWEQSSGAFSAPTRHEIADKEAGFDMIAPVLSFYDNVGVCLRKASSLIDMLSDNVTRQLLHHLNIDPVPSTTYVGQLVKQRVYFAPLRHVTLRC